MLQFQSLVETLTVTHAGVLQGVRDVEGPLPSKRGAAPGGDNERGPVRNGVGVDDEREHQPVCQDTPGSESI